MAAIIASVVLSAAAPAQAQEPSATYSHLSLQGTAGDVGAELLGGTVGAIGSAALGIGIFAVSGWALGCFEPDAELCGLGALFISLPLTGVAALMLIPAGVSIAGDLSGGDGAYWSSLFGTALGASVGGALFVAGHSAQIHVAPLLLVALSFTIAGSVIGYRVSAPEHWSVSIAPSFDASGAGLAAHGRF